MSDDQTTHDRLISIFNRKGDTGNSIFYCNDHQIVAKGLEGDEIPIIYSNDDTSSWILTTRRIIYTGSDCQINLSDIKEIRPAGFGTERKETWHVIRILTQSSEKELEVEPGGPYFGMLSVLMNVVSRNRKQFAAGLNR